MFNNFSGKIPYNPHNAELLRDVEKEAVKYDGTKAQALTLSDFDSFLKTGDRWIYEKHYIEHRKRLLVFTVMALSSDDDKWIKNTEDAIWAVLDEFSWALPAHCKGNSFMECMYNIDLFAGETVAMLSEIYYLLGDRLSDFVRDRMEYEVRRRIIDVYKNNDIKWEKNNWSAVCGCGVAFAFMYMAKREDFDAVSDRIVESMNRFLDSYNDDGACLEGPLYWAYGFGHFCFCAALLREYTNGEIDFFKNEKVRNIAGFFNIMFIKDNYVIPFSDASHRLNFDVGLIHFLKKEYPEIKVPSSDFENRFGDDNRFRFLTFLRNFFWYDESIKPDTTDLGNVFLPSSQWYIKRSENTFFAAKGGNNNEPHNHNDIGSFIVFSDDKFIIDDPGWNEYDDKYFSEHRYEYFCASSSGHSVPIVNGKTQCAGDDIKAVVVSHSDSEFSLDISSAYDMEVIRKFAFSDGIEIRDSFAGDIKNVTERLVTRVKPVVDKNTVTIGNKKICAECDSDFSVSVSTQKYMPRLNINHFDGNSEQTAYCIDFTVNTECEKLMFKIKISEGL